MAHKSAARQFVLDLLLAGITTAAGLVAFRYLHAHFDPATQKRDAARRLGDEKLRRLGRRVELDEWEEQIATELILPSQIAESFESIGGLENVVSSLHEGVIAPLCYPELFSQMTSAEGGSGAGLLGAPKGVLLYGPPGTGKTMLAKALAKESGATFINMHVSTLTNKWFGESNKLVAALFSLARKLQPSIIFIDEIDAFLRDRGSGDHEATGMMKAEFMTLWDGLTSSSDRILVLGATNRPNDIDAAFLRRMPKRYSVPLPDAVQRLKILRLMLASSRLDPSFKFEPLVARTEGCSGSDLKELCRAAAMQPVREYLRSGKGKAKVLSLKEAQKTRRIESGEAEEREKATVETRPIRNADFFVVEGSTSVGVSAGAKKG